MAKDIENFVERFTRSEEEIRTTKKAAQQKISIVHLAEKNVSSAYKKHANLLYNSEIAANLNRSKTKTTEIIKLKIAPNVLGNL